MFGDVGIIPNHLKAVDHSTYFNQGTDNAFYIDLSTLPTAVSLLMNSPFEWVPEQLSRFLTDPTIATLLEHPGQ